MKRLLFIVGLLFACALSISATTAFLSDPVKLAGSSVKISTGTGHGSGVHLGNGYFLTAGHVTQGASKVKVQTDDGKTHDGEVLWNNHGYDVSLVHVEDHAGIASSPLSCAPNYIGQNISIIGNPLGTEFAQSWGRVAGLSKTGLEQIDGDLWKVLVTLDITAAPGVSGGPIFNDMGEVVGILVAGAVSLRGTFAYSYGVPGTAVCHVLGRTQA